MLENFVVATTMSDAHRGRIVDRMRRYTFGIVVVIAGLALAGPAQADWTRVNGQSDLDGASLNAIACPSATHCFAAGRIGGDSALFEGDSGSWSHDTGGPTGGSFNGISCISESDCVAVGDYATGGGGFNVYHPLIETSFGSGWTQASSLPEPGDTYNFLFGVSCFAGTPNRCIAVGYYASTSGSDHGQHTFVLEGQQAGVGSAWTWTQLTSQDPGMTNNSLHAVSCPTTDKCIAVGMAQTFFQPSGNFNGTLAEEGTLSGGTWTWSELGTDDSGIALGGLSCTSAASCLAVGADGNNNGASMSWAGSGAFAPTTNQPLDPGSHSNGLSGLACETASNCTAVGQQSDGTTTTDQAQQWDGSAWRQVTTPGVAGGLAGVSCDAGSNACTAAGSDTTNNAGLIETGSGYVPLTPPSATTGGAAAVHATSATLLGLVSSHGKDTTYHFDYGTGSPTTSTPAADIGSDDDVVASADLSGLQPSTTYHYRVVATNPDGTTTGHDRTFTTPAAEAAQTGSKGDTGPSGSSGPAGTPADSVVPASVVGRLDKAPVYGFSISDDRDTIEVNNSAPGGLVDVTPGSEKVGALDIERSPDLTTRTAFRSFANHATADHELDLFAPGTSRVEAQVMIQHSVQAREQIALGDRGLVETQAYQPEDVRVTVPPGSHLARSVLRTRSGRRHPLATLIRVLHTRYDVTTVIPTPSRFAADLAIGTKRIEPDTFNFGLERQVATQGQGHQVTLHPGNVKATALTFTAPLSHDLLAAWDSQRGGTYPNGKLTIPLGQGHSMFVEGNKVFFSHFRIGAGSATDPATDPVDASVRFKGLTIH